MQINYDASSFILGFMDGITVGSAISLGMYSGGSNRQNLLLVTVSDMIAGSISMGLANGLSIDGISNTERNVIRSGMLTGLGYLLGSGVSLVALLMTDNLQHAIAYIIFGSIILLIALGYWRSTIIKESIGLSIGKVLVIGLSAMMITFYAQRFIPHPK